MLKPQRWGGGVGGVALLDYLVIIQKNGYTLCYVYVCTTLEALCAFRIVLLLGKPVYLRLSMNERRVFLGL